ncbi:MULTISPECIES: LysR family transcriptional regulator [Rothia]|uniref:LysR family transcriptional regulator n=1 Tax=Rothia TaxID=32207 RepID=UPI00082B7C2C|nr:LysR family transcriptional regulator [Rothia sp. ND6WE1A]
MYDIRRLRMLLEIHERGTLTAAAKTLHLTSSAISQQISVLEKEAGTALIQKVGRGVQLTTAGLVLVEGARRVLEEFDSMKTRVESLTGEARGTVRIAIFQSASLALLPAALEYLQKNHPAVQLHAMQIEPEIGLNLTKSRQFDLTIAETYPNHFIPEIPELSYELLTEDRLNIIAPQATDAEELTEAQNLRWVFENTGNTSRQWAINLCRASGFEPRVDFDIDDVITHLHLVRAGYAAAIVPQFIVQSSGGLYGVKVLQTTQEHFRKIFMVTRRESQDQLSIGAVRDALKWAAHRDAEV